MKRVIYKDSHLFVGKYDIRTYKKVHGIDFISGSCIWREWNEIFYDIKSIKSAR